MKRSHFSAVIFDMDGLMFDTESAFSVAQTEIARRRGKEFTLAIKEKMMGQKPLHAVEIMLSELGISEDAEKVFAEQNEIYEKLLKTEAKVMPGLFELLDFLEKRNISKSISTSSLKKWADILLTRFGLNGRFEHITTGEDVDKGKPDPEMYLFAVAKLALPAASCLVLEDSSNGIRAAHAAGCFAVAVPNEFTREQDFSVADVIAESLSDEKIFSLFLRQNNISDVGRPKYYYC